MFLCFALRPCVCPSVCPSTPSVRYQLISGTVNPVDAKHCAHTHSLDTNDDPLPQIFQNGLLSRHQEADFFGYYCSRFCPEILQIITLYLYSHIPS